MFNDDHLRHQRGSYFFVVKFSDDGHNRRFSSPSYGSKFICGNAEVILNQRINFVYSLRRRCRGLSSVSLWPLLKRVTRRLPELTSVASSTHKLLKRCLQSPSSLPWPVISILMAAFKKGDPAST